jgi:Protein of unknown function DUF104
MAQSIEATYENGVFVRAQNPTLADHERVRFTVEPLSTPPTGSPPTPRHNGRRIQLDSRLAQEIARASEFHPDEAVQLTEICFSANTKSPPTLAPFSSLRVASSITRTAIPLAPASRFK